MLLKPMKIGNLFTEYGWGYPSQLSGALYVALGLGIGRQAFLSTIHCSLFPVPCSLFPVPCSLFPVPCSLFPVPCSLFPVPCSLFAVACSLFPVPCSLFPVPCSLFPVPCSLFPVPCSLFPVPCSLPYSCLNASIGCTLAARRAGIQLEASATASNTRMPAENVTG